MARSLDELLEQVRSDANRSSSVSRLDLLLDLGQSHDPSVLPVLLHIMADRDEPRAVRVGAMKLVRSGHLAPIERPRIAAAIVDLLAHGADPQLRLQAALALGDFTDVDGVLDELGGIALGIGESVELRYTACTARERAEPSPAYLTRLAQLAGDERG
jgi:hypothetical protein